MPRTKVDLIDNPIRIARKEDGYNLQQFAERCGVHYQALYLNEHGCYPTILPKIADYFRGTGRDITLLEKAYRDFQRQLRSLVNFERDYKLPAPDGEAPIRTFYTSIGYSRSKLAKSLAIQPALLYRLEQGQLKHLPSQVESALRDAGLSTAVLEELNARTEEHFYETKRR